MLASAATILIVADSIRRYNLSNVVVDPVCELGLVPPFLLSHLTDQGHGGNQWCAAAP